MCRLGVASHQFAGLSMDYLVDMFNDEIEAVRLKAISTLRQISAEVRLREDQLETVLGILEVRTCVIMQEHIQWNVTNSCTQGTNTKFNLLKVQKFCYT